MRERPTHVTLQDNFLQKGGPQGSAAQKDSPLSRLADFGSRILQPLSDWRQVNFKQTHHGAKVRPKRYFTAFNEKLVLDAHDLENELQPLKRGAEDGAQGYPGADSTILDKFHRDLLICAERRQRQQTANRIDILQRLSADLNQISIDQPKEKLDQIFNTTVRVDLKRVFEDYKRELLQRRLDMGVASRQYSLFRTQNCRTVDPRSSSLPRTLFACALLLIVVVLEIFANASLLADATGAGLSGGFGIAACVAVINVLPSFIAGNTIGGAMLLKTRGKNNKCRRAFLSYVAILAVFTFFAFMAFCNAGFAHSRLRLVEWKDFERVSSQAVETFLQNPFAWAFDLKSLIMFAVGMAAVFVAFYEGLTGFGDPYPRYTRMKRQMDRARKRFAETRDDASDEVTEIFSTARDQMDELLRNNEERLQFFVEQMRQFQSLASIHGVELMRADNVINMVAQTYREANIAHRAQMPAPATFNAPLSLTLQYGFETRPPSERYDSLVQQQNVLRLGVTAYLEQITDQERIERQRLQRLLEEVEGLANASLNQMAPVMNEAQARTYDF